MSDYDSLFPDVFYCNGEIVTMDDKNPKAQAVAVKKDRIVAVGTTGELQEIVGPKTRIVDLIGKTMLPGLIEPHNHFGQYGLLSLGCVNLNSPPLGRIFKISELIEVLKDQANKTPKKNWIIGYGYDDTLLAEERHPTRYDLDKASQEHPIFIRHISWHFGVANTMALEMAGVTRDTIQPVGGVIWKDTRTSEPDGVLEGMPAQTIIARLLPSANLEQRMEGISLASNHYLKVGITSSSDAGVAFPWSGNRMEIVAYQKAVTQGLLPIRTTMMISIEVLMGNRGENIAFLTGFGDNRLKIGPAKIIVDGAIQGYTGWFTKPYYIPFKGNKIYTGYPVTPPEKLNSLVREAHIAGLQIAAHANGDAAIDAILEAYRLAQKEYPRPDARHRIEHCQTVREDQLDIMAKLGVTPSFFVSHTYYWGDRHKAIFLGPERARRISPLKSAVAMGMKFSIHSDCPVTPASPLFCVFAAVNRITKGGEVLGPEYQLTPQEALRAVTVDAAWQTFDEKIKGTIEVDKLADFTILAENPLKTLPERIKEIKVEEVIIAGQSVYKAG